MAAGQGGQEEEEVYVSFILSARNDGHEGNFMLRLQTSLDQLAAAGRMYPSLSAELVLVEWATPTPAFIAKSSALAAGVAARAHCQGPACHT